MRRLSLILLFIFSVSAIHAQLSSTDLVNELNKNITLYSADNAAKLTLYETLGTIEQKIDENRVQRFKLSEIGEIHVDKNVSGFTVNILCHDSSHCISLLKSDMSTSMMPSNAFFFTEANAANSFARNLELLIAKYPSDQKPVQTKYAIEPKVNNASKETVTVKPAIQQTKQAVKKSDDEESSDDIEDKKNARKELVEERNSQRAEAVAKERAMSKKKQKDDDENADDDVDEKKKVKKEAAVEVDSKKAEALAKERAMNRRKPKEKEEVIQDEDTENKTSEKKQRDVVDEKNPIDDLTEPVCKQLMAIIKAGKDSKFKEIEGRETNPTNKINDSKLKLKGAKRSYLSWYKKERAFMAEYKTLAERDLIIEEFDKLQTSLEDCLEGGWEDIDHSGDEMYANVSDQVKDVEYKFTADPQRPSLRIMINTDKAGKHTLFIRIQ